MILRLKSTGVCMDQTEAAQQVADIVGEWWREHRKPMLLSALGGKRSGEIAATAKELSGGLRAFIERHLPDEVLVVQHRARPTIAGAVPCAADDGNQDWDALLDAVTASPTAPTRYLPAFWSAFRHPLADTESRYLTASGTVRYTNQPNAQPAPDQMIEVQRDFVAGPDAADSEVHAKIRAWLAQSGINPARFRASGDSGVLPSNDVLGKLIQALDPDELTQISMPMPIVAKLRRKSA